ncbi:hypothetical protein RYX36_009941 [Vicia faba]
MELKRHGEAERIGEIAVLLAPCETEANRAKGSLYGNWLKLVCGGSLEMLDERLCLASNVNGGDEDEAETEREGYEPAETEENSYA